MEKLLNTDDLVELHEKLNEFAKYHQNKGGQAAYKLIKDMWDESKVATRDSSPEGLIIDMGYDSAMKTVLSAIHHKFVP